MTIERKANAPGDQRQAMNLASFPKPSKRRRRSGILGGSFNPVHTGHLLMAQDAAEYFALDRVLFLPCATPPHKDGSDLAPTEHRLAMLSAAIAAVPHFELCTLEIERGGLSYSVDTVKQLKSEYRNDIFFFIIGDDSLVDLPNWYRIDVLLELCEFVTMARPGIVLAPETPAIKDPEQRHRLLTRRRVGHSLNVSSMEIRKRVANRRPIRYLVPEPVAEYIDRHELYRARPSTTPHHCRRPTAG